MSRSLRVVVQGLAVGRCFLDEQASRYVVKVHRKVAGDTIEVFDPQGGVRCSGAIIESDRLPRIQVKVEGLEPAPFYEMPLTLLVAVGKSDKPEQAVRDATALGADEVVLVHSERSVARSEGQGRSERLLRVAEQVARQCERGRLPVLRGPFPFSEVIRPSQCSGKRLICAFVPGARGLLGQLQEHPFPSRVSIFVGPEGGFTPSEVHRALEAGFEAVTLGPYVLRAETACAHALSVARALWVQQSWPFSDEL